MKETLVKIENIKAYYKLGDRVVKAVDDISFEIREDEVIGVVGESGCGKSTLSNVLMMNIIKPLTIVGGKVLFKAENTYIDIASYKREEIREQVEMILN